MIYTVFPEDENRMPQDFATYQEAIEYGKEYENGEFRVESTTGEIV